MIFHVTKNDEGKPVDFFVHVNNPRQKERYDGPSGCPCRRVYPVVMTSIGMMHVQQGAKVDRQKFLCDCHGELVG